MGWTPHPRNEINAPKWMRHCNHLNRTDRSVQMKLATVGINLAKNVFQVHGVDEHGSTALCVSNSSATS